MLPVSTSLDEPLHARPGTDHCWRIKTLIQFNVVEMRLKAIKNGLEMEVAVSPR